MRKIIRHNKHKKHYKTLIIFIILLFITLSTAYSAFNTNIKLIAKGNVYNKSELCYETSDNGDGTLIITDYDASCGTEVTIPSTIKGKVVTKIGDTAWNGYKVFNHKNLTSVTIPDTVTYIGANAFSCNKIETITLGKKIQAIGGEAFSHNQITTLKFPESLKYISEGAFIDNKITEIPSLDNITYYGPGAFSGNKVKQENAFIYYKNSNGEIDNTILNSYASRDFIDTLNIPNNVKTAQYYSLAYAYTNTINFPEGFETLENSTFKHTTISAVNFPSSIKNIDIGAFGEIYLSPSSSSNIINININKNEGSIEGSPWGATNATVNWIG